MTEAGWTSNAPTKEGWYWWRQEKGMMEVPREVVYSPFYRGLVTQGERLVTGDGEWLGPITPDSYQQGRVEGLREAANVVREWCAVLGDAPESTAYHASNGVREAISQLEQLAQQAQKEKGVGE